MDKRVLLLSYHTNNVSYSQHMLFVNYIPSAHTYWIGIIKIMKELDMVIYVHQIN